MKSRVNTDVARCAKRCEERDWPPPVRRSTVEDRTRLKYVGNPAGVISAGFFYRHGITRDI